MSSVVKQEEHEQQTAIYQCRNEHGLQSMRAWLYSKRDKLNALWMDATGEDLSRLQGEAKLVVKQIKMIDQGPAIREEMKHGN